jgi:hypothetical protein
MASMAALSRPSETLGTHSTSFSHIAHHEGHNGFGGELALHLGLDLSLKERAAATQDLGPKGEAISRDHRPAKPGPLHLGIL